MSFVENLDTNTTNTVDGKQLHLIQQFHRDQVDNSSRHEMKYRELSTIESTSTTTDEEDTITIKSDSPRPKLVPLSAREPAGESDDCESIVNDVVDIVYSSVCLDLLENCTSAVKVAMYPSNHSSPTRPSSKSPYRNAVPPLDPVVLNGNLASNNKGNSPTSTLDTISHRPHYLVHDKANVKSLDELANAVVGLQKELAQVVKVSQSGYDSDSLASQNSVRPSQERHPAGSVPKDKSAFGCFTCNETQRMVATILQSVNAVKFELEDLKLNQQRIVEIIKLSPNIGRMSSPEKEAKPAQNYANNNHTSKPSPAHQQMLSRSTPVQGGSTKPRTTSPHVSRQLSASSCDSSSAHKRPSSASNAHKPKAEAKSVARKPSPSPVGRRGADPIRTPTKRSPRTAKPPPSPSITRSANYALAQSMPVPVCSTPTDGYGNVMQQPQPPPSPTLNASRSPHPPQFTDRPARTTKLVSPRSMHRASVPAPKPAGEHSLNKRDGGGGYNSDTYAAGASSYFYGGRRQESAMSGRLSVAKGHAHEPRQMIGKPPRDAWSANVNNDSTSGVSTNRSNKTTTSVGSDDTRDVLERSRALLEKVRQSNRHFKNYLSTQGGASAGRREANTAGVSRCGRDGGGGGGPAERMAREAKAILQETLMRDNNTGTSGSAYSFSRSVDSPAAMTRQRQAPLKERVENGRPNGVTRTPPPSATMSNGFGRERRPSIEEVPAPPASRRSRSQSPTVYENVERSRVDDDDQQMVDSILRKYLESPTNNAQYSDQRD